MSEEKEAISPVEIYPGWCKKCDICIAFCPPQVLATDEEGYPFLKEPERCTRCGWCEIRCPDFAIVVRGKVSEQESDSASG